MYDGSGYFSKIAKAKGKNAFEKVLSISFHRFILILGSLYKISAEQTNNATNFLRVLPSDRYPNDIGIIYLY